MCQHTHGVERTRRGFLSAIVPTSLIARRAFAQPPQAQPPQNMAVRFPRNVRRLVELKGLAEPFKGTGTTDGKVVPGLFPIQATGVSTAASCAAPRRSSSLRQSSAQRDKTMFAIDDPEWRKWMNQHFYERQGVSFKDMNEAQRTAAFGLAADRTKRSRLRS